MNTLSADLDNFRPWHSVADGQAVLYDLRLSTRRNLSGQNFPIGLKPTSAAEAELVAFFDMQLPPLLGADSRSYPVVGLDSATTDCLCAEGFLDARFLGRSGVGLVASQDYRLVARTNQVDHLTIWSRVGGVRDVHRLLETFGDHFSLLHRIEAAFAEQGRQWVQSPQFGYLTADIQHAGRAVMADFLLMAPTWQPPDGTDLASPPNWVRFLDRRCADSGLRWGYTSWGLPGADIWRVSVWPGPTVPEGGFAREFARFAIYCIDYCTDCYRRVATDRLVVDTIYRALGTLRFARRISLSDYRTAVARIFWGWMRGLLRDELKVLPLSLAGIVLPVQAETISSILEEDLANRGRQALSLLVADRPPDGGTDV